MATITVETTINAPIEKVWQCWTEPAHIQQWNAASPDWHTPRASVELHAGGMFNLRMEARDGSMGFDLTGHYTRVEPMQRIDSELGDGRKVSVEFVPTASGIHVRETFEAEGTHSIEQQRAGWQAILDNFARHVEGHA